MKMGFLHSVVVVSLWLLLFFIAYSSTSIAATVPQDRDKYEDDDIKLRVYRRSPKQIAAFYEGRGFPSNAIEQIKKYCSISIVIKNKTYDVMWLELDRWQFTVNGKLIHRIKREFWHQLWKDIDLAQSYRSTYGWTLMPEVRDLRIDEGVGGAIPLPMQDNAFTIKAIFATGEDKQGKMKTVVLDNVRCKSDENES